MFCRVSDTNHQAYEYLMYVGQQSPVALTEIERGKRAVRSEACVKKASANHR